MKKIIATFALLCALSAGAFGQTADDYFNQGNAYYNQGDYYRAITAFTSAIRLNPNYAEAYDYRGIAYGITGDYTRAIADIETALRIDPNNTNARRALELARQLAQ